MSHLSPIALGLRTFLYTCTIAALSHGLALLAQAVGGHDFSVESSPIEWAQFALTLIAAGLFVSASSRHRDYRLLLRLAAALCLAATLRETDKLSADFVFASAYWIASSLIMFWAFLPLLSRRERFLNEARAFLGSPAFILAWVGLAIVMFAQLFGQKELWQAVMETTQEPYRTAKNMAEEGVEFLGYLFLVFAAVESRFLGPRETKP